MRRFHFKSFWLLSLVSMVFVGSIDAQNLVFNGDFEEHVECPFFLDELELLNAWNGLGTADPSPDFFHGCSAQGKMGVPQNFFGYRPARSGSGYVGIISYLTTREGRSWDLPSNHREYLLTSLERPLYAGKDYYAEMYISLAEECEFAISEMAMYFSEERPQIRWNMLEMELIKPQVTSGPQPIEEKERWVKVSGTFTAKGGERYLVIGNFTDDSRLQTKRNGAFTRNIFSKEADIPKKLRPMIAYYFIEDVRVEPLDPEESLNPPLASIQSMEPKTISDDPYFGDLEIGETIKLENIYFEFNRANLLPKSYEELTALIQLMVNNPGIRIQVVGHTDNIGDLSYNQDLSEARAKSVIDYMRESGIAGDRLTYRGFGSTKPVASNETEAGRALNRRVEFIILSP